eukprot:9508683-Alexandrium_andersonii.AAC.1
MPPRLFGVGPGTSFPQFPAPLHLCCSTCAPAETSRRALASRSSLSFCALAETESVVHSLVSRARAKRQDCTECGLE